MFKKFTLTLALVMAFCLNASAAKVSYSASFTAGAPADWVALDNNADGVTWAYDAALASMAISANAKVESDDYYVSPALTLEAGVTYTITTVVRNNYFSGGSITLKYGTSLTDAASYTDISALNPVADWDNWSYTTETFTFTPAVAGEYYFAFHSNMPAGGTSFNLGSFSIEGGEDSGETVEPGEGEEGGETETPELAEGQFVVTENFDDDTHFTASATVPDGWASAGSFPFGRAIATDYGMLANSGSYVIASVRQQYDTSVDEVIYTPLKKLIAGKECTLSFYIYAPGGLPAATFYQTVTVKAGTAQTADAQTIEVGAITAAVSAWTKYEYTFTPEADGEYCFSLAIARSSALNRDHGLLLFDDFTITGYSPAEEETPAVETVALPYSIDFTVTAEGWTALDLSTSGSVTWKYNETGYYYSGNKPAVSIDYGVHNDYWISPAFALEAGKSYKVISKSTNMDRGSSVLTLQLGTDIANAESFASIATLNPSTAYADYSAQPTEENTFSVKTSGVYYLAFHLFTDSEYTDKGYDLLSFEIVEAGTVEPEPEPEVPEVVTATLPYSIDFTAAAPTDWSVINVTGGDTWGYLSDGYEATAPAVSINNNASGNTTAFDDYYVSPQFALEAGKKYKVSTRTSNPWATCTFTLEMGTSVVDESTYSTIATLTPAGWEETYDPSTVEAETFEVTVAESGNYFLAFHVKMDAFWVGPSLVGFAIEEIVEETPVTPEIAAIPYSIDFTTSQEGWTALANDEDATVWKYVSGKYWGKNYNGTWIPCVEHEYGWNSNDLWVSPAFTLNAGKKYKVSIRTEMKSTSAATPSVGIALGTSATDASTFSTLTTFTPVNYGSSVAVASIPFDEYTFTAAADGVYYLAVSYVATGGTQHNDVDLFDFSIEEIVDPLYVIGSCQGWDPSNGLEMTYADGVYTLENVEFADYGNFSFTTVKGSDSNDWTSLSGNRYGFATDNAVVAENEAVEIIKGEGAIQIPIAGVYTIVADIKAMTVTVTCTDVAYDNLYVLGNYKESSSSWNPSYGVELTKVEEGVFSGEVELYEVHEGETGTGKAYFNITPALGANWDELNAATVRFGADEYNKAIAASQTQTLVQNGPKTDNTDNDPYSWVVDAKDECLVNMTVNLKKRTIAINSITGIENVGVDADDSEAVYYNLQGIEVVNPAKGNIYIVKRGNRVTKELK